MVRKWSTAAATLGALVLLTPVLGIFGLASDSVSSDDNSVASGTFAVASHDLQVAKVAVDACDPAASFSDGPIAAAFSSTSVEIGGSVVSQVDDFCLLNAGTSTGRVRVTFANVLETDPLCETSEADAGDATCGGFGGVGELSQITEVSFALANNGSSASCTATAATGWEVFTSSGVVIDTDLAPGERCAVFMTVRAGNVGSDTEKLIAQTDQIQWDIVFTLEDIPA